MKPNRLTCLGLGIATGAAMHDGTLSLVVGVGLTAGPWVLAGLAHIVSAIKCLDEKMWDRVERHEPLRVITDWEFVTPTPASAHHQWQAQTMYRLGCRCTDCVSLYKNYEHWTIPQPISDNR